MDRGHVFRPVRAGDLPVGAPLANDLHHDGLGLGRLLHLYLGAAEAEDTRVVVVQDYYARHVASWHSTASVLCESNPSPGRRRDGEVELEILRLLVLGVLDNVDGHRLLRLPPSEEHVHVDRGVVVLGLGSAVDSLDVHLAPPGAVTSPRNHAVHLFIGLFDHVMGAAMLDVTRDITRPVRAAEQRLRGRVPALVVRGELLVRALPRKRQRLALEHHAGGLHSHLRPGRLGVELVVHQLLHVVPHVLVFTILRPYERHHLCLLLLGRVRGEDQLGL
mmetsp:Transcript_71963/g.187615  ORF Transcript_71963/g.187615 Transcript_71963/m.187615 type:complete len:276 (-) Transcript_71963:638-1465(-)